MFPPGVFRPSRVLGLLLSAVLGLSAGLVYWQTTLPMDDARKFAGAQWVVAFAAFAALTGWIVNAIVTIRNSVKQHTVSTLLQSRLSQLYMQKAGEVNAALAPPGESYRKLTVEQVGGKESAVVVDGVRYFLNYFEFIAVGVRHGDLDEDLMRGSLRGIVSRLSDAGHELIRVESGETTGKPNKTYEHLKWLNRRWADGARNAAVELAVVLLAYGVVAVAVAYYAGPTLGALTAAPGGTIGATAGPPKAPASVPHLKPAK